MIYITQQKPDKKFGIGTIQLATVAENKMASEPWFKQTGRHTLMEKNIETLPALSKMLVKSQSLPQSYEKEQSFEIPQGLDRTQNIWVSGDMDTTEDAIFVLFASEDVAMV